MIGNYITFSALGYVALCTIIMLFVHGATKLPELPGEEGKPRGDQLPLATKLAASR